MSGHDLSRIQVGIIGGGHLGRALARALPGAGIRPDNIHISFAGNPQTLRELEKAGLSGNIAENTAICDKSDLIFLAIRPQSLLSLRGLALQRAALVVSCMAGIPCHLVEETLCRPVVRMMPSGPETLTGHNGIVAVYPASPLLEVILAGIGQEVCSLPEESVMDIFTAGVCLPAVLIFLRFHNRDADTEIRPVIREYPLMEQLYAWGTAAVPSDIAPEEGHTYIVRMSTKGGITEAIIASLARGEPLETAFRAGVARCAALRDGAGCRDP
ncbi:MAG: NAD(P)-binding domain-containing protein [Methanoregula sp.]|jgi:pyrroline-5-carboxylate reductase